MIIESIGTDQTFKIDKKSLVFKCEALYHETEMQRIDVIKNEYLKYFEGAG